MKKRSKRSSGGKKSAARAKRKSLVSRKRARRSGGQSAFTMVEVPGPFFGVRPEDVPQAAQQIGMAHEEMQAAAVSRLQALILEQDPIQLLGELQLKWRYFRRELHPKDDSEAFMASLELLRALILQYQRSEFSDSIPRPETVEEIARNLRLAHQGFGFKRLASPMLDGEGQPDALNVLLERIRVHTQFVRTPGYQAQTERYLRGVLGPVDARIMDVLSFSVDACMAALAWIADAHETRIMDKVRRGASVWGAGPKTPSEVVHAYYKAYPDLEGSPEEFMADNLVPPEMWDSALQHHLSFRLAHDLVVSVQEVANGAEIPESQARAILCVLSHSFGDLEKTEIEHLFMGNPTWSVPNIQLDADRFLILEPTPHVVFPFRLIDRWTGASQSLKRAAELSRAQYLEAETGRLLRTAFPAAAVDSNVKWVDPRDGKEYETDHVVLWDDSLLIVENKSGRVRPASKRGAKGTLRKDAKALLLEGAEQSARLLSLLRESGSVEARREDGTTIAIARCNEMFRFTVTVEAIPLHSRAPELVELGLFSAEEGRDLCPSMTLFDLDTVFASLETPYERWDYLKKRDWLDRSLSFGGDEIDVLVFYLKTGLNFLPDVGPDQRFVQLSGLSYELDPFFMGLTTKKPSPIRTKWMQATFDRVVTALPKRMASSLASVLLSISPDDQERLDRARAKLVKARKTRKWNSPVKSFIEFTWGPAGSRRGLVLLGLKERGVGALSEDWAHEAAASVVDQTDIGVVPVFVVSPGGGRWPYRRLILHGRGTGADDG